MRKFGLLGYPLLHSFSKIWFNDKFDRERIDAHYDTYPIPSIGLFPELIDENPDFEGLNVTIPYKQAVIPYLDALDEETKAIGAVNVIKFIKNDKGRPFMKGFNSDLYGFRESIRPYVEIVRKQAGEGTILKALILGTGGASKAIDYGMKQLGVSTMFVSRTSADGRFSYKELLPEHYKEYQIIINSTPLGMSPNTETCADLDYSLINSGHLLFDAVYNPDKTLFLKKGEARGAIIKNGLEMLHLQAERAWEIWNL
jgi:shikimate dehydrogenase